MKKKRFIIGLLAFILGTLMILGVISDRAFAKKSEGLSSDARTRIQEAYGNLPLYFIRNDGQLNNRVKFYEHGRGHSTFFTKEGVYLRFYTHESEPKGKIKSAIQNSKSEIIGLLPLGANKEPEIIADELQKGKVNYLIGNDKKKWRTNIPTYQAIMYKEVYSGVDMRFYGNNCQLEYDIIIKPGADPSVVKLSYEGIKCLQITEKGDLDIILQEARLTQKKPYVYQEIDGKIVEVVGKFKILNIQSTDQKPKSIYGFEVASYNKNYPLIIDPILVYSTYLGGSDNEQYVKIAVDTAGNAYMAGSTYSSDFPTQNHIQGSNAGSWDVFVTKIDPSGSSLSYSTYLGGNDQDTSISIAVDTAGNAYITGETHSNDFPTQNPIQGDLAGGFDAFVAKIDPSGSGLSYSTYLGGSSGWEQGYGEIGRYIAVDTAGSAYITGLTNSTDFPTKNPIQGSYGGGSYDAFVTKIDPSGSSLSYSTYLGGNGEDQGYGIAIDTAGNAYIAGGTQSTDFPTQNPIQASYAGWGDGFITKIDPSGSSLSYSTYLGGSDWDFCHDVAVDIVGNAYIAGTVNSTDFPTQNPIQASYGGGDFDAFIAKLNPSGSSLSYSTYLGGNGWDGVFDIAVDIFGSAYITGRTSSTDFPTQNPIQASYAGEYDAFITKINPSGSSLSFSTYLGGSGWDEPFGIAVDSACKVYITGHTSSIDFLTRNPIQGSSAGLQDAFIAKIDSDLVAAPTAVWKPILQEGTLALDGSGSSDVDGEIISYDWQLVGQDGTHSLQGAVASLEDIPWGCYDGTLIVVDNEGLPGSITFLICKPKCESTTDVDGDGYPVENDCDDNNPAINPGAQEICDGIDNNCDGQIDEGFDSDGDGFTSCGENKDCDDSNASINPAAVELPGNNIDENCDGSLGGCDPEVTWRNHGEYVRCVANEVEALFNAGIITEEEGNKLVNSAAQSDIGKNSDF